MNPKTTPILLVIAVLLGLLAFLSERSRTVTSPQAARRGERVLNINQADISRIRVKKDYWNSFALARESDGTWRLIDPANELASVEAVGNLLSALESLPIMAKINLPSDDTERYREYGLWKPAVEVTVSSRGGDQTLRFGGPTSDGQGVYCARTKQDTVYITHAAVLQTLSMGLERYRQAASVSNTNRLTRSNSIPPVTK